MKIDEAIKWLEYKPRFKEKTDLFKMGNALKILKNPQKNFKTVHVTGTNGKGSVCHYLSRTLKENFKVGLFTSPYVLKFNERLQINDIEISDETLLNYILWAKEFDENYFNEFNERFSFFELLTIIMIKYFNDEKVDYAIVEVGIGGRLDSTNVIEADYAVITSLGLDHVIQLGDTKESILKEKLGILKKDKTLFTAIKEFKDIINEDILNKNAKVYYVNENDYQIVNNYPLMFNYDNEIYESGLQGIYQIENAILAIKVLKELNIDNLVIKDGIKNTINPGRFEIISKNPFIVLDGAHNVEAVTKLTESIKEIFKGKSVKVLFGSMEDKPYLKMINVLKSLSVDIYLTSVDYPRALKDFSGDIFKGLKVYGEPIEAFNEIKDTLEDDEVLVITGSMYLVSLIRNYFFSLNIN